MTTDKMIASIHHDLPIMYSNYSMYGATTPVSEGGSLAILNAELLAGLVFGQLVKEGSKMILGSLPAAFDMQSMGSDYTPTSYLLNLACAEMMAFYKLPHCGTSGSSPKAINTPTPTAPTAAAATPNFCFRPLSSIKSVTGSRRCCGVTPNKT